MKHWTLPLIAAVLVSPAWGTQEPPLAGVPTPQVVPMAGQPNRNPAPRKVTINFSAVPLRQAIVLLFQGTGYSVNIMSTVTDVPVTLELKDTDFDDALRAVLNAGSVPPQALAYTRDRSGTVYTVERRGDAREPEVFRAIQLHYLDAAAVARDVLTPMKLEGISSLAAAPRENTLIVRGREPALRELMEMLASLDQPAAQGAIEFRVQIAGKVDGRTINFRDVVRTVPGSQANIEEGTTAGKGSRYKVQLSARSQGETMLVTHNWEISLPLGTGGGAVRLEKRIASTTPIKLGQTVEVGRVNASQWGGTGELILLLQVQRAGS